MSVKIKEMAQNWKRKEDIQKKREREDLLERGLKKEESVSQSRGSEKLFEYLDRAEKLLDQLDPLYRQYVLGVEKRPPLERRKQLDQLMETLILIEKPTAGGRFRFQGLMARYRSYVEKWERILKQKEGIK